MADDPFKAARKKLADAMDALRTVTVQAGGRDARMAGYAMESMGSAFMYLEPRNETANPAWES